jgi:hypothetical protein
MNGGKRKRPAREAYARIYGTPEVLSTPAMAGLAALGRL